MTATVPLSDEDLSELRELTSIDDPEAAVLSALCEYRRYARRMRLKEVSGKVALEENWRALEQAEADESGSH